MRVLSDSTCAHKELAEASGALEAFAQDWTLLRAAVDHSVAENPKLGKNRE